MGQLDGSAWRASLNGRDTIQGGLRSPGTVEEVTGLGASEGLLVYPAAIVQPFQTAPPQSALFRPMPCTSVKTKKLKYRVARGVIMHALAQGSGPILITYQSTSRVS